jgi:hypothetical protein
VAQLSAADCAQQIPLTDIVGYMFTDAFSLSIEIKLGKHFESDYIELLFCLLFCCYVQITNESFV